MGVLFGTTDRLLCGLELVDTFVVDVSVKVEASVVNAVTETEDVIGLLVCWEEFFVDLPALDVSVTVTVTILV